MQTKQYTKFTLGLACAVNDLHPFYANDLFSCHICYVKKWQMFSCVKSGFSPLMLRFMGGAVNPEKKAKTEACDFGKLSIWLNVLHRTL